MPCWRPGAHPASRPRRRPGPQAPVPGGEDHEATRSGKGGSRLLARNRLPPTGVPCHEAVRAPGHAAPCTAVKHPRPGRSRASRSPTSGNCSRAGLLARIVVLERDFQPGRTAVILARQPSPRTSPVTLVMCPGTPLRPAVGRRQSRQPPSPCLAGKAGRIWPVQAQDGPLRDIAAAWCQAAGRAQLGGDAAARASAQARASAASSTAASARSMAQAA